MPPTTPEDDDVPNASRTYDYLLGGASNFRADRTLAQAAIAVRPLLPQMIRINRIFLGRAVRWCLGEGITRFLDLGSGIPTVGNVHEIALPRDPAAQVVYVDREPVAVVRARELLADEPGATMLEADIRDVDALLAAPEVRALLDPGEPVALVAVAVLHFLADADRPREVLERYLAAMPPGSVLVLSHGTSDGQSARSGAIGELYRRTPTPLAVRTRDEVAALVEGVELVEPGIVFTPVWRPTTPPPPPFAEHPEQAGFYAAVGRIR